MEAHLPRRSRRASLGDSDCTPACFAGAEFERIGGSRRIRADIRVIAATNRDLQAAISAGSLRSDLFYRLNVFPIEIPSLRERRADIPLLVEYFIDRYARKAGKNIKRVNKKTLELLQSYPWAGKTFANCRTSSSVRSYLRNGDFLDRRKLVTKASRLCQNRKTQWSFPAVSWRKRRK